MSSDSVIHDIGYQRYTGRRLGRRYVVRSLYTHGLRTAYGLGRKVTAKLFPWAVVGIVTVVAVVLTAIRSQTGTRVLSYVEFSDRVSFLILLFCAAVAPELVSRDLRSGVLPLYFSRPLARSDYALAKLAAMVTAVWLMVAGPLLLMFVGGAFTLHGVGKVWDEFLDFLPGLGYAALYAFVFSALSMLIASLVGRRAIAAAIIVAVFLVTTPVVGVLSVAPSESLQQLAGIASPLTVVSGVGQWLFGLRNNGLGIGPYGPVYGLVVVALVGICVPLLLIRYRTVAR
jgi:ABC-2 type transport system permease protein